MPESLKPGLVHEMSIEVTEANIVSQEAPVFSTPQMVLLMEQASLNCVKPYLPHGSITVGTHLQISHRAASPRGSWITARSELMEVDGRRLVFQVVAFDEVELIGDGIHERAIVNLARFLAKLEDRQPKP
ncbi:MAG: thioesterase family protein [Coprothermobacterota bacterium]|jgi:predicted thioesterase|nr:thioesterase family protein [Coprothermobacterota bacterium]